MAGQDKNQGNRPRSDSHFRPKLDEKFKGLLASSHNGLHKGLTRQRAIERQNDFASKLTPTYLRSLMASFDSNHNMKLSKEELADVLQMLAGGKPPTDEEILFVLHAADVKHVDNAIDIDELSDAIKIWKNYLENKPTIDKILDDFDFNYNHKIEVDELTRFLRELNDGLEPLRHEVDWVMLHADGHGAGCFERGSVTEVRTAKDGFIDRFELTHAISLWYTYQDMNNMERRQAIVEVLNNDHAKKGSTCCNIT